MNLYDRLNEANWLNGSYGPLVNEDDLDLEFIHTVTRLFKDNRPAFRALRRRYQQPSFGDEVSAVATEMENAKNNNRAIKSAIQSLI